MALLNFNYGLVKDLPQNVINGNLYVTTDTQGLYVDLDDTRIHVSDFIQVESVEALNALGTYYTQVFYYVTGSNALMKYTGDAETPWKQLNSTADLSSELEALKKRVSDAEADITSLETAVSNLDDKIDALNATDIETTQEITVTTAVGNYTKGQKIAADTDLQTLILNMLCKDSNPTATQPSITSVSLTGAGAKEVGTTFSPAYSINTDPGKYTANSVKQDSGVTFSNYSAVEVGRPDDTEEETLATSKGTFSSFIVTDTTNYYVKGSVDHSDGNMPLTYLKKEYPSVRITAKTLGPVSSSVVTGYRPIFYGMSANTDPLTSATIRALTKIEAVPAAQSLGTINSDGRYESFIAANMANVKRFIVAIPTDSGLGVTKATILSSMNADATSNYKKIGTVAVEGANNYTTTASYDIWIYQPASIASVEIHEVTIG